MMCSGPHAYLHQSGSRSGSRKDNDRKSSNSRTLLGPHDSDAAATAAALSTEKTVACEES